ncbi:hypothetical protein BC829DRAFT_419022 [Chytridium lagenaria]|nr:hypothetical protein BC829DRAFT_419022 [Chytridium lagenaria]
MLDLLNYDFSLERAVIQESEMDAREASANEDRHRQLEVARKERRLKETRKKAPGFTGDNNVIMQPRQATLGGKGVVVAAGDVKEEVEKAEVEKAEKGSREIDKMDEGVGSGIISPDRIAARRKSQQEATVKPVSQIKPTSTSPFNFSEFEHGLAPPDPWDTRQDDFNALKEVMGPPTHTSAPAPSPPRSTPLARSHTLPTHSTPMNYPMVYALQPPQPQLPPKPSGWRTQYTPDEPPKEPPTDMAPPLPLPPPPVEKNTVPKNVPAQLEAMYKSYAFMGFSEGAILSAFKIHGDKESKHLDHLVAFDKVVSEGVKPDDASDAIGAVGTKDMGETVRFAKAVGYLSEFGFVREKVVEALKVKKGDKELALEMLMA